MAARAAMAGRFMTAWTTRAQAPAPSARRRETNGIVPRSTRSPRMERTAGRKTRLPRTETRMTAIVPTAIVWKTATGIRKSPASEIITAMPLKKTARPAVELATSIAASRPRPARRSERKRVIMNRE